jgi:hypothetical protein
MALRGKGVSIIRRADIEGVVESAKLPLVGIDHHWASGPELPAEIVRVLTAKSSMDRHVPFRRTQINGYSGFRTSTIGTIPPLKVNGRSNLEPARSSRLLAVAPTGRPGIKAATLGGPRTTAAHQVRACGSVR